MELYKAVFNKDKDKGVYSLSVVETPAMESNFIALSKQENIQLAEVDAKEFTLLGVALIPDKLVYRNQGGREFNLVFPKETIQQTAHNFIQMGYQGNSSLEHETSIDGVSIVESWIVKDPKNDTANAYGLDSEDIKEGSWVVKMKCDNKDIYNKALNGEIKGFSIDALLSLELIKTETKMSKNESIFFTKIKELFDNKETVEVKFGSAELTDGVVFMFEGEELAEGVAVWVEAEAEEGAEPIKEALPDGEYSLEGKTMTVKDGMVESLVDAEAEATEESAEDMELAQLEEMLKAMVNFKADIKSNLDGVSLELAEMKKLNETLKAEVLELSKQPAKEIKKPTEQKSNIKLSLVERLSNLNNK
jgi:hypothetical protein